MHYLTAIARHSPHMHCPWCETSLTWHPEDRGDRHHPREPAGWLCEDCGRFWTSEPTDADYEAAAVELGEA